MTQAVFGDNDGAVGDKAEVERAHAHQIGADMSFFLDDACREHQHGDGNNERRDQRRTEISKQHEQDNDDEHRAFGKIWPLS